MMCIVYLPKSLVISIRPRGFKMASLNITSLLKHLDELKILLNDNPIDVLAINETRLDSSITDCEVFIPGYEIFRRDRNTNGRHGGGVCFYVRTSINCTPRHDLNFKDLENLCIEIRKPRSKPFLVASWYRPPDSLVLINSIALRRLSVRWMLRAWSIILWVI